MNIGLIYLKNINDYTIGENKARKQILFSYFLYKKYNVYSNDDNVILITDKSGEKDMFDDVYDIEDEFDIDYDVKEYFEEIPYPDNNIGKYAMSAMAKQGWKTYYENNKEIMEGWNLC